VAVTLVRGHIRYGHTSDLFIASLLLGILNAFIRPILLLMALPLLIFTLGLFTIVINALLLYFVGWLLQPAFEIDNFWWALLGSIIISIISLALNTLTGSGNSRVTFQRRRRPPDSDGGGGPVIDV
jgi:putative membrane protein